MTNPQAAVQHVVNHPGSFCCHSSAASRRAAAAAGRPAGV